MIAVLHSSHECLHFASVRSILHHWHIPYVVYGIGEPRRCNRDKIHTFLKAVHDLKDEHLLFIDAWDIICLRGPDELIARFESLGHPWLVAAEPNCWPDKNLASRHAPCDTQYRYLNSGGMMLRREYALKWASKVVTSTIYDGAYHYSDQYWWMLRHFENPDLFKLDTRCEMFQCLYLSRHLMQYSLWDAFNTSTGTHPLVIHANNNGKIDHLRGQLWDVDLPCPTPGCTSPPPSALHPC